MMPFHRSVRKRPWRSTNQSSLWSHRRETTIISIVMPAVFLREEGVQKTYLQHAGGEPVTCSSHAHTNTDQPAVQGENVSKRHPSSSPSLSVTVRRPARSTSPNSRGSAQWRSRSGTAGFWEGLRGCSASSVRKEPRSLKQTHLFYK